MEGVLFATAEGDILDANEEACRVLGRTREELLAPGGGEIFDPSDPRYAAAYDEQRETGTFRGRLRTLRGIPGGGSTEPFEAQVTVVGYRDGIGEERLVIVVHDVKAAREQRVRAKKSGKTQDTFPSLAGYVGDAVVVFEVDGSIRYVSPSAERLHGYKPEEMVGAVLLDVIHPDDLEQVVEACVEVWDHPGLAPPFTFRHRRKDDSWAHMELAMNNLLDEPGTNAVVTIVRDVTERVRAEEEVRRLNEELERRVAARTAELEDTVTELRERERILLAAFETTPNGLARLSPEGVCLKVNRETGRILGREHSELLGRGFHEFIHPVDARKDKENQRRMLAGESIGYTAEERYLRKDGSCIWVSVSATFMRQAKGRPDCFVLIIEDIDTRKRTELDLGSLTTREKEVLVLLARGKTGAQISEDLFISQSTIRFHTQNIVEKLGVENRTMAVTHAIELGLLSE